MRLLHASLPLLLAAGCLSRTVEPIDTRPPRPRPQAAPPQPAAPEEPVVRIRVPMIDDCCAPLLVRELRKLPGVLRVDNAELTLFIIERDPRIASNKAILDYLQKEWAPGRVESPESKEGP